MAEYEEESEEDMMKEDEAVAPEIKDENLILVTKAIEEGKLIIGTERTLKTMKQGHLAKVLMTQNAPKELVKDIEYYAQIANVQVLTLKIDNDEFGSYCRKPFSISIVGIKK